MKASAPNESKEIVLRTHIVIGLALLSMLLVGCGTLGLGGKATEDKAPKGSRVFLAVDFEPGRTLRYKFVSNRDILLDWDPDADSAADNAQRQSERVEMVVAYTPEVVDPYGVSTIRAVCESVEVERVGRPSGRGATSDAVDGAQGATFTFKVDPRGKLVDASELETLIKKLGAAAFRSGSGPRVKEPDMVGDFIASQWFLWEAVSSIENPAAGVAPGQTWRSQLSVPLPMVMRKAREVTYRLDEVRDSDTGRRAIVTSTYRLAESTPSDWPIPYAGRFQMSGTFGFLGGYQIQELAGTGREQFNIDAGRIETAEQKYTVRMKGSLPPMGLRANPHITIEQTLTMNLLNP